MSIGVRSDSKTPKVENRAPSESDEADKGDVREPQQAIEIDSSNIRRTPTRESSSVARLAARQAEGLVREHYKLNAAHAPALLDMLRTGRTDDRMRTDLRAHFKGLGMKESKEAMDAVRSAGLLDHFLKATLRDDEGRAVHPMVHVSVMRMMETGRLDAYAETLASTSFTAHDPATSGKLGLHHFAPGSNAIFINAGDPRFATGDIGGMAQIMAHETYHAFQAAHGGADGALNEGMGIAAARYAFTNNAYSIAEMVYGTKNFYRDSAFNDPNYPLGNFDRADPKLREFLDAMSTRDRSEVAWRNPDQLQREYVRFWERHHRFRDANGNGVADWVERGGYAEQAEREMLEARRRARLS